MDMEYIKSIDRRLSKIEEDVGEIKAGLVGLKIKVAGISTVIATAVAAGLRWFF